jgi:2-oxoglutarate ferredoxin oxidoreductase subunit delta
MAKNKARVEINTEWCKGCGICVVFCPKQVLVLNRREKSEVSKPENCTACMMCEWRCPDLAIEVITDPIEADSKHDSSDC